MVPSVLLAFFECEGISPTWEWSTFTASPGPRPVGLPIAMGRSAAEAVVLSAETRCVADSIGCPSTTFGLPSRPSSIQPSTALVATIEWWNVQRYWYTPGISARTEAAARVAIVLAQAPAAPTARPRTTLGQRAGHEPVTTPTTPAQQWHSMVTTRTRAQKISGR